MVATKKRRDFAIHFRNSHYQAVTISLALQKHRNSRLPPRLCQQARLDVFMYTHICLSSHDITETFRFALFIRYVPKRFCQQRAASPA